AVGCPRAHSETCACGRFSLPGVSDDLRMDTADRPLPAVQRAYFYLVALVAIHMVVLAVANLLRVGAEIAMGAPSGGFTGLPFVFNEFNRPRELYREQASLAIALLVVGLAVIGLFWAASTTVTTLAGIWDRIADAIAPIPGLTAPREVPPGVVVVTPPAPSRDDLLRFQLIGAVPGILAGLALWLSAWIP